MAKRMKIALPTITAAAEACPAELVCLGLVSSRGTIKPIINVDERRISITWQDRKSVV